MSPTLLRASLRELRLHPAQTGLATLGVAVGVASAVAIALANQSAWSAFELATRAVTGRATHEVRGGPSGVDEALYTRLRVEAGVEAAAPLLEGDVLAAPEADARRAGGAGPELGGGRALRVLGVDPFAEPRFRPQLVAVGDPAALRALLTEPGAALLHAGTARELGVGRGDALPVAVGSRREHLRVAGLLEPSGPVARRGLEDVAVVDLATAQALLGRPGRLSRIDLLAPEEAGAEARFLARVRAALPEEAWVARSGARAESAREMTSAFRINLTALSLLALVVGAFLVYNTLRFSVVRRRELLGRLRAVGVSRRELFALVLGEAFVVGSAGTALGLVLGVGLAHGLVHLVTRTVNDLYFAVSVRGLDVGPEVLAPGAALGVATALLAALAPAREATRVPARWTLARSALEGRSRAASGRAAAAGAALAAAGAVVLALPEGGLFAGFAGLFAILLGAALATPAVAAAAARALAAPLAAAAGPVGRMAARGIPASLSRTGVALAALVVAVAVSMGLSIMIESFRVTVADWLREGLRADVYVAPPRRVASRTEGTLDPALRRRVAALPEVARATTYRAVEADTPEGPVRLVALGVEARDHGRVALRRGDPERAWRRFLEEGALLVSEPLARHRGLAPGDRVAIRTDEGPRAYPVAGVYASYRSSRGELMMHRRTYERAFRDRGVTSLALDAAPGVAPEALVRAVRAAAGPERPLSVRSQAALREASLEVFDRTFAVTAALRAIATGVALAGMLAALLALALERRREVAVLRATGLLPRQVLGLLGLESGLLGAIAAALALPVGLAVAAVLVFVINRRSFGWSLELGLPAHELLGAAGLALAVALAAGLLPALRMARERPGPALRGE